MYRFISVIVTIIFSINLTAKSKMKIGMTSDNILKVISEYRNKILKNKRDSIYLYLDTEYVINVKKRNLVMKILPSMYPLAQGPRNYNGMSTSKLFLLKDKIQDINIESYEGNIPNKEVISIIKNLFFPCVYNPTIFGEFILSPCHSCNRWLYKYSYKKLSGRNIEMQFIPRNKNTQLITGKAIINKDTGKILSMQFDGELDMIKFNIKINMDEYSGNVYLPKYCAIKTDFAFLGNKINSFHEIRYSTCKNMSERGKQLYSSVMTQNKRKESNDSIKYRYTEIEEDDSINALKKTEECDSTDYVKQKVFFSKAYNYFIERIKGRFGAEYRGNYSISPLINPLYLGYSSKKGVTYKLKLNLGYAFTDKIIFSLSAKCGYSFKQKQFYTNIPVRLELGKYFSIDTDYGIGNHITNSEILNQLKHESYDSIKWNKLNLEYFKNMHWRFRFNIALNKSITLRQGIMYYKRSAVDRMGFISSGKPYKYYSFAPTLQLQIAPFRDKSAIITLDYERGIKGLMSSSSDYERFETDFSWKKELYSLRFLSLKTGYGQYTSRSKNSYFLDYNNFRYENMPDGWNDDWTGEFQLLESNWYNASEFYIRSNVTYESPMLILSRLPIIGKYLETERIYINFLFTDKLHPYIEYGYGFKNKIFSSGIFFATSNKKIDGFGVRFGLELFRDW